MKTIYPLICFLVYPVFAQEPLVPPPTKIILPSDTTLAPLTAEKLAADSSQLELPDVVVMGQNKSLRQVDQKKGGRSEKPRLLIPDGAYGPLSSWLRRSRDRQTTSGPLFQNQKTWMTLQAGSFSTLEARLGHWRKIHRGQAHGYVWFDQSHGEYNHSGYQQGGLAGKAEYQHSAAVKGLMQFQYDRFSRELHGATLNHYQRFGGQGGVAMQLSLDPRPLTNLQVNLDIKGMALNSDTTNHRLDESDDFYYSLSLAGRQVWSKLQVNLEARYLRETYDTRRDSISDLASFRQLHLEALYQLSSRWQASAGLGLQAMHADSAFDQTSLAPFGRIRYSPGDRFALALHGQSGLSYQPFFLRRQENPYLSHRYTMLPEESRFSLRVESEILLAAETHLQVILGKSWMDRLLYWQIDEPSGLFELTAGSGDLSEMHVIVTRSLGAASQLTLAAAAYSDQQDPLKGSERKTYLPYRPAWQASLQGRQVLAQTWIAPAAVEYWGERHNQPQTDQRLPDFALVRAGVQKEFNRHFSFWLTLQNIIDSKYVLWERYPETGFTILAGVRAQLP
jgi:hypothetical protein